jgi:rhodanese-related sulfurtransferase
MQRPSHETSRPTRRYHIPSALRSSPVRITPDRARELIGEGAVLVDVRRKSQDPPAPDDAVRIPPDEIPDSLERFSRDTPVVLACT